MKLRAFIAALHAALFAILLAVSPAGSGSMTLLGAGKPAAGGGTSPAFDAISSAINNNATATTTWTHTPVGTPTAVAVLIGDFAAAPTGVTYGGFSLTLADSESASTDVVYIYCLANPPAGAQSVVVTNNVTGFLSAYAVTVTGSNTSSCFSNTAVANGSSTTPGVTVTSATGELVIDVVDQDAGGTFTPNGGQTQQGTTLTNGGQHVAVSTKAGAASVTTGWTSTSGASWGNVSASFH